jgi:hypothetical protein
VAATTKRNKNLAAREHPSAKLDAKSQANALGSLNFTSNMRSSKRDEWEGSCSAQRVVKNVKNAKRDTLEPTNKYI